MQEEQPKLFTRLDAIITLGVGLLSLALYARTLAPGPLPNDSGEFQVLAYQLGIAHTTGYPVYLLLAKTFIALLPADNIAYNVNLFSAVMGALTVAGVYVCGRLIPVNRWAAAFGALALAVSYSFWSQALIAEVYTAGAFFVVAVLASLLIWHKTGDARALFAAGLLGGVGLGVHANLSIVAPAVVLYLLLDRKRWKVIWKPALLGALAGVVIFLGVFLLVDMHEAPANIFNAVYTPARSHWDLSEADVNSPITRTLFLVTAQQWRGAFFTDADLLAEHAANYIEYLPSELSWLAVGLAALGLVMLIRRDGRLAVLLGAALLLNWVFYFNYRVGDIHVFYIPGYIFMAILAAAGADAIAKLVARFEVKSKQIIQAAAMLIIIVAAVAPVIAPYTEAIQNGTVPFLEDWRFIASDQSELQYNIVANTIEHLEQDSIVFTGWMELYLYYYAAHIEQGRTDLQFIETYPYTTKKGLAESTLDFIEANLDTRPIYLTERVREIEQAGYKLSAFNINFMRFYKVERG